MIYFGNCQITTLLLNCFWHFCYKCESTNQKESDCCPNFCIIIRPFLFDFLWTSIKQNKIWINVTTMTMTWRMTIEIWEKCKKTVEFCNHWQKVHTYECVYVRKRCTSRSLYDVTKEYVLGCTVECRPRRICLLLHVLNHLV